jgi:hypothetical protein
MEDTHLCSRWQLSMKTGVRENVPNLYLVSADDLKSPVLVLKRIWDYVSHGKESSMFGQ